MQTESENRRLSQTLRGAMPHSGCAPEHSGCPPEHSGCAPEYSGCAPEPSGCPPKRARARWTKAAAPNAGGGAGRLGNHGRIKMIQNRRKNRWTTEYALSFTVGWWQESVGMLGQVAPAVSRFGRCAP
jgi:hypothetical protein